jgi:hypothetical protein
MQAQQIFFPHLRVLLVFTDGGKKKQTQFQGRRDKNTRRRYKSICRCVDHLVQIGVDVGRNTNIIDAGNSYFNGDIDGDIVKKNFEIAALLQISMPERSLNVP